MQKFDAYVEIDTIPGEATSTGFEKMIEIFDFNHKINQTPSASRSSSGSQATGRVDLGRISFEKEVDCATPQLMVACSEGRHISNIKFHFSRAGSAQNVYYTITLEDCLLTEVAQTGQGNKENNIVNERVELYFRRIQWEHFQTEQKGGGVSGSQVTGWDASTNTAF